MAISAAGRASGELQPGAETAQSAEPVCQCPVSSVPGSPPVEQIVTIVPGGDQGGTG